MRDELSFERILSEYGIEKLILKSECVITAYSGGADSSCLLRLMNDYCKKLGIIHAAAHVNHMIRGEEADKDEQFCRSVCDTLGIPIHVLRADVPAISEKTGKGLEETARIVRYSFFDEVAEKITGSKTSAIIATAHNADDNLETIIFNLLRGSGTHGMCGIQPLRDNRYIRPLLLASGSDIRRWCEENQVEYVVDNTNSDTEYTRNHIRHNIVPQLVKICPNPENAVSRMTSLLRRDDDFLEITARSYLSENASSIERETLASLHPAISSRILRIMYKNVAHSRDIEETHIRSALSILQNQSSESELSMPFGIKFKIDKKRAYFEQKNEDNKKPLYSGDTIFEYPTDGNKFENEMFCVTFSQEKRNSPKTNIDNIENIYKLFICSTFCFDKIIGTLRIRYRIPGDVYRFGKMTRKVKKLFIDKKMTKEEKEHTPIFFDDVGIVWIPGFPPRDGVAISNPNDTTELITCHIYKKNY